MLDTKLGLTVRLSEDHSAFFVELPSGANARITAEAFAATMRRLLIEQKRAQMDEDRLADREREMDKQQALLAHWMRFGVGTEPSPTEQQLWHQEHHAETPKDTCPFCRAEGRAAPAGRARNTTERRVGDVVIRKAKRELSLEDL